MRRKDTMRKASAGDACADVALPAAPLGRGDELALGPAEILALAVASLADIPASDRDLLTRKLGERDR